MEAETKTFIEELAKVRSKYELTVKVDREREAIATILNRKTPDPSDYQNKHLLSVYQEINYIHKGLSTDVWAKVLTDEKRFDSIKEAIDNILKKFKNIINFLEIENFKSINHLEIKCKRINIFLGEPNVGKSNILEALALYSAPFSQLLKPGTHSNTIPLFAWDQIRYNAIRNLFYFQDNSKPLKVITDVGIAQIRLLIPQQENYEFIIAASEDELNNIKSKDELYGNRQKVETFTSNSKQGFAPNYYLTIHKDGHFQFSDPTQEMLAYRGFIKKYVFNETYFKEEKEHNKYPYFLLPAYGSNLFTIIQGNNDLADLVIGFFEKYDLEFIYIQKQDEYVIQFKKGRVAYQLPYDSIADTLQRIIFHLAAIYSNKDSVLLFEEPEAHNFPTYINLLGREILYSTSNQFFITSHSPYLVETLIEKGDANDVAVFTCSYKDNHTEIRELTSEELGDIKKYNYDLVFNIEKLEK